ncbi:MAG TPA: pilus assembly protein PilP [Methylotenera sp.]|jgi:type IV pilus assembly protein PilP|nr:pilus assembly protein PilP [Methylotenera sp.]
MMMFNLMPFNLLLKSTSIIMLVTLLTACSGSEGDDLDKFMASAANDMGKGVEPLPEVMPYSPLEYNADGTLTDPFRARKAQSKEGALQPNTNRPKEALEAFPLESLKYVGSLSRNKSVFALIKTPDNTIQQVKTGNYIGPNFGLITQINESDIVVKEIVQDDLTGDWVERNASINLQE